MAGGQSLLNEHSPRILPGLPRKSLTPEQQLEALRKVQAQAEQRVKLGMQLFKSAEARLAAHADLVSQVRSEQKHLREKVTQDVTDRLSAYDHKLDQLDDRLDEVVQALEGKIDAIAAEWRQAQSQWQQTRDRCEALLDQSQRLLDEGQALRTEPQAPIRSTPLDQLDDGEPQAAIAPAVPRSVDPPVDEPQGEFPDPIPLPPQAAADPLPSVREAESETQPAAAADAGPETDAGADLDPDERIYSQILSRLREQDQNDAA